MELDLRRAGKLPVEYCKFIAKIEEPTRKKYNEFTTSLIEKNRIDSLAWYSRVTCRNTHLSGLLQSFCRIELLRFILSKNIKINIIRVDTYGMYKVSKRLVNLMHSDAKVLLSKSSYISRKPLLINLIKSVYKLLNSFVWPKLIGNKKIPNKKVIYIDTFLFINSFNSENSYIDRYYPGIEKLIKDNSKIWYSPSLIGINHPSEYLKIFKSVRASSKQFLIKEDWLKFSDYFSALISSFTLTRKFKIIPLFENLKIDELIHEEIKKDVFSMDFINPILIYLFIKRLKRSKIDIELVVDWNENQVIDRALIMGIRNFYPGIRIHGYQGYIVPDFYTCKDPTIVEMDSKTLPDEIFVIGNKFVNDKKKYCPSLPVSVAPAFRFFEIKKIKRDFNTISNTILLILPISIDESKEIINIGLKLTELIGNEYSLYIKQHPTYTTEKFYKIFPEIETSKIQILEKDLYSLLSNTNLLISSSSSVCFEASLIGIKVAIIGSRNGFTFNPLSSINELKNWKVCYSEFEVLELLKNPEVPLDIDTEDYLSSVKSSNLLEY